MATDTKEREPLMRVEDVAEALGQSRSTIYRKVASGEIPYVKLGHGPSAHIRVPERAFRAWLYGEDGAA
jgi:excisionase family DNA binding protein